jgi:GTP-binding protein Era
MQDEDKVTRCGYAAIVGRPNVGKSTLINRLIGQKIAITSHKPQTTRHAILGIKTTDEGQILFVDTPGIHKRGGKALNRILNQTAESILPDVDVIVFVVQAGSWTEEDEKVLKGIKRSGRPTILVLNKMDKLERREEALQLLSELSKKHAFEQMIPASALQGKQVDVIESEVMKLLPEDDIWYPEDQVTDRSERFLAAELLREQLTRRYAKELPYAVTVEIERFEDEGSRYRISAVVWVEKPGQKGILLGHKGGAMKETARIARESMESSFGRKVWLDVWVKVKKSWSSDERSIASLGYTDQ